MTGDTMVVDVKQHHIDGGIPDNCWRCPIAGAIKDQYEPADVSVHGNGHAWVEYVMGSPRCFQLPPEACEFINTFDAQGHTAVKPFSFTMIEI